MVFLKYESTSVYLVHASENRILPYDSTKDLKSIFIYSWLKYRNSSVFTCRIDSKYRCKITHNYQIHQVAKRCWFSTTNLRYVLVLLFVCILCTGVIRLPGLRFVIRATIGLVPTEYTLMFDRLKAGKFVIVLFYYVLFVLSFHRTV